MSFTDAISIAASGLTAQRVRMDVTSENLANADTTQGANGQPYRRQEVVVQQSGGFGAALLPDRRHGHEHRQVDVPEDAGSAQVIPAISGAIGPLGPSEWSVGQLGGLGAAGPAGTNAAGGVNGTFSNALTGAIDSLDQT